MAKGIDCATTLTLELAQQLKAAGYDFVCRYYPAGLLKSLTREEAAAISQAGMQIVVVFETTAERALGGREAGLEDGARANQAAAEIGQPIWSTIYFAVDFDASNEQMPTVIEYIKGASDATPNFTTGIYGSFAVIEAAVNANACSHFWQTYAWSGGQKSPYMNLYQYQNGADVCGVDVDLNESYGNEGWFAVDVPVQPPPLSAEDANYTIERWIQHEYDLASDEDKTKRKYLANQLRKASGQPEQ